MKPVFLVLGKLAIAIVAVAASACSSSTDATRADTLSASADFQTGSASYTLRATTIGYQGDIDVTYTNHTAATAKFENCRGETAVVLDKLVDGKWQGVWSPLLFACASLPIVVGRGEQHHFTVSVFGGYPDENVVPKFSTIDIPGSYRLEWGALSGEYQGTPPLSGPLPLEHRVSNTFTIAVEPRR